MANPTIPGVVLHPIEVDLLCTFAEVQAPFPIEVGVPATSDVERGVLYQAASQELMERGLADENGPLDVAEEFVYLLRSGTGVLDLVLNKDSGTTRVAVLTSADEALLVSQDTTDQHRMVRMWAATLDDAIGCLAHLIPPAEMPLTAPFSVPLRPLEEAFQVMLARHPAPMSAAEVEDLVRSHGIDDRAVRRMVSHLQPVLGNGQCGVARRDDSEDQWHRASEELRWLDTDRGRYRLAVIDDGWMSVNPLGLDELYAELRGLAARIR
ncbi:ESX secretion-associated protein EspG [Actinokineospora enzanensis]|uniref:ESX secretion-associated protein EspG n=1 Tax=Actinokineospora enzanensis TaxID=155975 RepID=UPI00037E7CF9|nr:ESX secretion-associated protein EspG [Actinokineospora enzanensis]